MLNIGFFLEFSILFVLLLLKGPPLIRDFRPFLIAIVIRCVVFNILIFNIPIEYLSENVSSFNFLYIPILFTSKPILIYYYICAIISIIFLLVVINHDNIKKQKLMHKIIIILSISSITFFITTEIFKNYIVNVLGESIYWILLCISGIIAGYIIFIIFIQFIYNYIRHKNNWYWKIILFPHVYFIGMNWYKAGLDFDTKGLSKSEECNKKYEISKKQLEDFIDSLKRGLYLCDTNVFVYSKLKKYNKIYNFKVRKIYNYDEVLKNTKKTFFDIYGNNCGKCDLDDTTCKFSQKSIENYPYCLLFFMLKFRIK